MAKPLTPLEDDIAEGAKVSARDVAVAVIDASTFAGDVTAITPAFQVYADKTTQICVTYQSRNGLYYGEQTFSVDQPGWALITYESRYITQLKQAGSKSLAVRAVLAEDCSNIGRGAPLTLVRSVSTVQAEPVALVHADGYPTSIETYAPGERTPVSRQNCAPFDNLQSVRFDRQCPIDEVAFRSGYLTAIVVRPPGDRKVHRLRVVPLELSKSKDE